MSSKIGPDRGAIDEMKQAADSVYFQQRLPDEFYKVQLLLDYRSLKQLNPDHCYRSSLINIIKRNFVFESVKHSNGKRRNM